MPKLRTHKATAKRFRRSSRDKILRRKAGQNHFNSRESGKITRSKRRDILAHETNVKAIKVLTPYS